MNYVLMLITIFTATNGVHSETRFQEFGNRAACEKAATTIESSVVNMKGTLGREVIVQCHALK